MTTQLLNRALEYLRTPEVTHTSNQWQPNPCNDEWEEVYKMNCNIREDTAYNRSTGTRVPKAWHVTWNLYLNTAKNGFNLHIAGQNHKRYTDKIAAYKYLAGRKKAYAHLRQAFLPGEVSPEESNQIGQELAMSLTKGKNAFVVCTHIDRHHVHNHIIINFSVRRMRSRHRRWRSQGFGESPRFIS